MTSEPDEQHDDEQERRGGGQRLGACCWPLAGRKAMDAKIAPKA
jgi:hypothetical protein